MSSRHGKRNHFLATSKQSEEVSLRKNMHDFRTSTDSQKSKLWKSEFENFKIIFGIFVFHFYI
jgi:hypothetical protein